MENKKFWTLQPSGNEVLRDLKKENEKKGEKKKDKKKEVKTEPLLIPDQES